MPDRPTRESLVLAAVLAAAALLACRAQAPAPVPCAALEDCPAAARCLSGACVANAPPRPALSLPGEALETNTLLSFDASGSTDPDEGDAVVSWAWAFRAVSAPCAPPVSAGSGARAVVRFACPGRYAADVTVADTMSLGATWTEEFDVAPRAGPALVEVGPDVALDHACAALQTRCAPSGEVHLSAAAPSLDAQDLSFAWTVEPPPDRPLDPARRRVLFTPDAGVAAPSVLIETDGAAISGDWIFRVEVRDAAGVVGAGATRVSVGNRPPVVEEAIPVPDHAFEGTRLTARGEVRFTLSDPDNDALVVRAPEWRHAGDGDGTFGGELLAEPGRVTFEVAVPWTGPEDALHLIGGDGLDRSIVFAVEDPNGGVTSEAWPIAIGNRPPVLVAPPAVTAFDHLYDAAARRYRAAVSLSSWADPDGDPLSQVPGSQTGDPACPLVTIPDGSGARIAAAGCEVPFSGSLSLANFVGAHVVTQHVQDPWAAAAPSAVTFTIGNRPPVVTSTAVHVASGECRAAGCCRMGPDECLAFDFAAPPARTTIPSRWADPDGDPVEVRMQAHPQLAAQPLVCTPPDCPLTLDIAAMTVCASETLTTYTDASDGVAATALTTLPVRRSCWAPF